MLSKGGVISHLTCSAGNIKILKIINLASNCISSMLGS